MRPIDADAAIQWVEENECYTDKFKRIMEGVIDKQPTVDAVPVVRCRECIHRDPEDHRCDCGGHEWVIGKIIPVEDDWFCADGERKDGEHD